jgi:hypothetical protein
MDLRTKKERASRRKFFAARVVDGAGPVAFRSIFANGGIVKAL